MSYFHDVEGPATHPIITAVDPRGPLERKYINVDESHLCGQLSQPTIVCSDTFKELLVDLSKCALRLGRSTTLFFFGTSLFNVFL